MRLAGIVARREVNRRAPPARSPPGGAPGRHWRGPSGEQIITGKTLQGESLCTGRWRRGDWVANGGAQAAGANARRIHDAVLGSGKRGGG